MTTASRPLRIAPSRTLVRGILVGSLCGIVGGPATVVVITALSAFAWGLPDAIFALFAVMPAAIVGAVVGAAAGFAGAATAVAAVAGARRLPRPTIGATRRSASIGAAAGSAITIGVAAIVYSPSSGLAWWLAAILAPATGVVAARIAGKNLDSLLSGPEMPARQQWAWRVLLTGFSLAVAGLLHAFLLIADSNGWGWSQGQVGRTPVVGLAALVVITSTSATLLVAGVLLARRSVPTSPPIEAALVTVAIVAIVGLIGVGGITHDRRGDDWDAAAPYLSDPAAPMPQEPPAEVEPAQRPESVEGATTLFTLDEVTAASQAQVDATIAAVGPIDDPAIPADTTTFPASVGGCDNMAGGRVNFEVWFLVDDLPGGFARAGDAWLAQGFASEGDISGSRIAVTGGEDSAIRAMTLEDKGGTVRFTLQSACVAGEDY